MRTFEFGRHPLFEFNTRRFIVLGTEKSGTDQQNHLLFRQKLQYEFKGTVDGVWGTLGWEDNSSFALRGSIDLSIGGNNDEGSGHQLTAAEIADLKEINPLPEGEVQ